MASFWILPLLCGLTLQATDVSFEASFNTFQNAVGAGNKMLAEHAEIMVSGEDPNTQLISIKSAREFGIMSIASGREKK